MGGVSPGSGPGNRPSGKPPAGKPRYGRAAQALASSETYWMFGIHAVRAALLNPARKRHRLIVTLNAAKQLEAEIAQAGIEPEISDARRFSAPIDKASVHQGVALETRPLDWGRLDTLCAPEDGAVLLLLDRVTDPHNVGAILRSAEVFGARGIIAPTRHSAPESGALAKAASGALERQPYLRVRNLADTMIELQELGWAMIGLDGEAPKGISDVISAAGRMPLGLVLGAEGDGLRERTRNTCDGLARIIPAGGFASLNVSNAAAVALFAATQDDRLQPEGQGG